MSNQRGQSLLEVIVAMAIFGMIAAAMISFAIGGFLSLKQGGDQIEAEALAQQGIEAVRAIRDSAWNKLTYTTSSVAIVSSTWAFTGENTTSTIGQYTRVISFENVCRDGSGNIAACPGASTDLQVKKATVTVTWSPRPGVTNSVQKITYLSNWNSREWTQTDWAGGTGQAIWSDITKYDSDDNNLDRSTAGEIKLKSAGAGCGIKNWTFSTSTDYTYNPAKIIVTSSMAQLVDAGTGGSCGGTATVCSAFNASSTCTAQSGCGWGITATGTTINPDFTTNNTGWAYTDWENAGRVGGNRSNTGGNPGGYIRVTLSGAANTTISGYWTQSFVTTQASSTGVVSFDWAATAYVATGLTDFRVYVFVDDVAGAPTIGNEVWVSPPITSITSWASITNLDISSKLGVAGTHYVKLVVRGIYGAGGTGNSIGGFDNVLLTWSGPNVCSGTPTACNTFVTSPTCSAQNGCTWTPIAVYPTDNPTINPVSPYSVPAVDLWSSFSETATKNGGEIYYQLSDNGGSTWKYWNGSSWASAGATNYNIASVINTNITTFTTSTQIMFKAFLSSNGNQLVQLDNVQVSCEKQYNWTFATSSDYSYNPAKITVTSSVAQLVDQGGGGSCGGTATVCSAFSTSTTCSAQSGCSWATSATGSSTNPTFDVNTTGWTYTDWENAGRASGVRVTTGGNPGGYVNVAINGGKNTTISGFWVQPFTTTVSNPTGTISFDWEIPAYVSTGMTSFYVYVFVDDVSGFPTVGTEVWRSALITSVSSWVTVSNLDITSKLGVAGTHYIKIAARGIYGATGAGVTTAGFDNVLVNWTGPKTCSGTPTACNTFGTSPTCTAQGGCTWTSAALYPTDNPAIYPTVPLTVASLDIWSSFAETATKGTGEIYYQLSDNGGSTWKYWNGSAWATAGAGNYNTASVINTNISTFSTSTQIFFKAFLSSNGSQQVSLDNVRVGWGASSGVGYSTSGYLVSSAFNMADASPVQFVNWDENTSTCAPSCSIKLQLRTAPNNAGSPGTWTSWYGATGAGLYFTDHSGSLVPTILNGNQWVQYRAELAGDGASTPVLQEVRVNYK